MTGIELTLSDWVAIWGLFITAMTPAYVMLHHMTQEVSKMREHVASIASVVQNCPYCMRNGGHEK